MGKKGIIFDLDGVIVDTAKYHYLAWKDLADSLEIHFDEIMNEQLKGVSRIRSLEKILEWGNKRLTIKEFDKHLIEKNAEYLSYIGLFVKYHKKRSPKATFLTKLTKKLILLEIIIYNDIQLPSASAYRVAEVPSSFVTSNLN